ncbi:MAG: hypothetical protein IKZ09_10485 [Clostridia bacterium]|nr:hypothetical protein [Clostridia bacterium]
MPKNKPHIKKRSTAKPQHALLPGLLRAAVISLGCGMGALLLLCTVLLGTSDPCTYALTAAVLIPFPIAVVCGVLSARNSTLGGLPSGLLGGAVLCLMLFSVGMILPAASITASPLLSAPLRAGICLLLSSVGGYCATHRKPKTHRRHP